MTKIKAVICTVLFGIIVFGILIVSFSIKSYYGHSLYSLISSGICGYWICGKIKAFYKWLMTEKTKSDQKSLM